MASLTAAVDAGGRSHILRVSDRQPGSWGPRRVTEAELRAAFADGWQVEAIQPERFETNSDGPPVEAWLATVVRRFPGPLRVPSAVVASWPGRRRHRPRPWRPASRPPSCRLRGARRPPRRRSPRRFPRGRPARTG